MERLIPELWILVFKLKSLEVKDILNLSETSTYLYEICHLYGKYINNKPYEIGYEIIESKVLIPKKYKCWTKIIKSIYTLGNLKRRFLIF